MLELPASVDLHVAGHLSAEDAARQHRTTAEILRRFADQPGLILGDEVGMGKTFVALAVAAAHIVSDATRPVVVMVPQAVVRKWMRDADTFRRACIQNEVERSRFRVKCAYSGIEFLKLLDDPEDRRATLVILSHTAPTRRLADRWVKLAMLQASIKGKHGVAQLRQRLARFAPMLLREASEPGKYANEFLTLLSADTGEWRKLLIRFEWLNELDDDPVPQAFVESLADMDLSEAYERIVQVLPERSSSNIRDRIKLARAAMDGAGGIFSKVWKACLGRMKFALPLLVLDEAHRMKNAHTQLASLLSESREDLERAGGMFANTFERMLFLTATPFQLGHSELCNVLSRFKSVRWNSINAPTMTQGAFEQVLNTLLSDLDDMQRKTDRLEMAWKQLLTADIEEAVRAHGESWWEIETIDNSSSEVNIANDRVWAVRRAFAEARQAIRDSERGIKTWVLRHSRPANLPPPNASIPRRRRLEGAAVRADIVELAENPSHGGLRIRGESTLPFFLAARLLTIPDCPSVFAGGIASSFDALLDTERDDSPPEEAISAIADVEARAGWYYKRLRAAANTLDANGYSAHPKMATTVDLAMSLWRRGEKVLIFCFYRHTGGALHRALSEKMLAELERRASERFGCSTEDAAREIARISNRWDKDTPAAREVVALLDSLMDQFPKLFDASDPDEAAADQDDEAAVKRFTMTESAIRESIHAVVLRFLRTPTFLLRFAPTEDITDHDEYVRRCFEGADESGMNLRALVEQFLKFLASRPSASTRQEYLDALKTVQTGTHAGPEVSQSFEGDAAVDGRVKLMPNVRRVFGDTRDETRQRIMLTFNTPFYPEILIASSVMAEGVDLHLNCRHIIHHDLDWNPSTIEQRTGRVDRLGAKAEQCGRSIRVYVPYLEGCHDEKQFRVMTDRERWFGVVMGAEESISRILNASAWEMDRIVNQPSIPAAMASALAMNLATPRPEEEKSGGLFDVQHIESTLAAKI